MAALRGDGCRRCSYNETTFLLQFPIWWAYALSLSAALLAAIVGVYMAFVRVIEFLTMPHHRGFGGGRPLTNFEIGLTSFPVLLLLIFLRVPIGLSMFLVGMFGLYLVTGGWNMALSRLKSETYSTFSSYSLSIVPMFLLMGHFATLGGMSTALFKAAESWLGHKRGGVAMAAVGACAGLRFDLRIVAGHGRDDEPGRAARTAALWLFRRVFHRHAGGGRHAGHPDPAQRDPGDLRHPDRAEHRQAVPGGVHSRHSGRDWLYYHHLDLCPHPPRCGGHARGRFPIPSGFRALLDVWPVLMVFLTVVGGIYLGWFTPTEGAAVGAFGTGLIAFLNGGLGRVTLVESFLATGRSTAMIFFIVLGAAFYNGFLALTQVPQELAEFVGGLGYSPWVILAVILALYLVFGCVMDSLSMILLTIPIFFPIVSQLDFGLTLEETAIWFGIIVLIVVEVGLITPPVGMNLFVINSMDRSTPMVATYRAVMYFVASDIVRVVILVAFPSITLFLLRVLH